MKSVGITGPQGAGKTTLWTAVGGGGTSTEVTAVPVSDERLDRLTGLHSSKKRVPVQIQLVDVHAAERTQASALARLREMDALLVVVGAFGGTDPEGALSGVLDDFILADLGPIENRISKASKDAGLKDEVAALSRAKQVLEEGALLSTEDWGSNERQVFSSISPLTLKPITVVWNVGEDQGQPPGTDLPSFTVMGALEAEVAGLDEASSRELLEAYGVTETALDKLVVAVYRSLDLITFYTTSDKESRAWEVRKGATAPEAAGVIHSDMERGFIRAEVAKFEDVVAAGSWDAAKAAGKVGAEGKAYVFQDGDVTHFRFAV